MSHDQDAYTGLTYTYTAHERHYIPFLMCFVSNECPRPVRKCLLVFVLHHSFGGQHVQKHHFHREAELFVDANLWRYYMPGDA